MASFSASLSSDSSIAPPPETGAPEVTGISALSEGASAAGASPSPPAAESIPDSKALISS